MIRKNTLVPRLYLAAMALPALLYSSLSPAEFAMNFSHPAAFDSGSVTFSYPNGHGLEGAISQQIVTVDGVDYWHNIVGDPNTGFAYESYTRYRGIGLGARHEGAGMEGGNGWTYNCGGMNNSSGNMCGNMTNPLGPVHIGGSGGSNVPDKMTFRMVINGNGMNLEVYKPLLGAKPMITQSITDGDLRSEYTADMRTLIYDDKDTSVPIVNNQTLTDPTLPFAGAADFTMLMARDSTQAAGRYSYTPGLGPTTTSQVGDPTISGSGTLSSAALATPFDPNYKFDLGVYSYAAGAGSFDPFTVNWKSYLNLSDNPDCVNTAASFQRVDRRPASCQ